MTERTHAEPAGPATRTTRDLTKAAVSGWLGTAMEFMDFQLYSLAAAIVFNKIFFPNVSPAIGLIAAMATYGVGYVARLAGAIYFGRMGDRHRPQEGAVSDDRADGRLDHAHRGAARPTR